MSQVEPLQQPVKEDALVRLDHISVRFEKDRVINDVTWNLVRGRSVLVVGPSGCGKSTLAMLVAGLIPGAVEAEVTGSVWRDAGLATPGQVGYVFQDADSQFCQIRVGEEVAFGLENQALAPALMNEGIADGLMRAGISLPFDVEHAGLSGGNKQKLAIASALALKPELLILDEPTANLDPASTAEVFAEIAKLLDAGRTLMVIEHKFEALTKLIPCMLLMDAQGQVRAFGPTQEVMRQEAEWMAEVGLLENHSHRPLVPPSPGPMVLSLENIYARYKGQSAPALQKVSLSVRQGELIALLGANGAGKSTLLKVLAGLVKPLDGERRFHGDVDVAFGFQNPEHQFIFERVVDELANHPVQGSVPAEVKQGLRTFGLWEQALQSPYALSQGQKRRLSVAVMLQQPHALYCLDEPTFGQDVASRRIIMEQLVRRQVQGAAVVISTHDLSLVEQYATRVVVIDDGHIVFDGDLASLRERPDILRQARLMPSENDSAKAMQASQQSVFALPKPKTAKSLSGRLNPVWKLCDVLVAAGLTAFAHRLDQAILLALIPLILLLFFSGLEPLGVAKRILPFAMFFALYTWMMTAYAAVGPHTPVVHVLWYRLSYPGFIKGLILGLRMFSQVGFGLWFVSTVDLVKLVKGLSHDLHVPPKFSYGTLAGLRFFPQFQDEWTKLRLARKVRGKDAHWSLQRVTTYALPLLSDAVRLSERVAIAMEARGFVGPAAASSSGRTYYHPSKTYLFDFVFGLLVLCAVIGSLWH